MIYMHRYKNREVIFHVIGEIQQLNCGLSHLYNTSTWDWISIEISLVEITISGRFVVYSLFRSGAETWIARRYVSIYHNQVVVDYLSLSPMKGYSKLKTLRNCRLLGCLTVAIQIKTCRYGDVLMTSICGFRIIHGTYQNSNRIGTQIYRA